MPKWMSARCRSRTAILAPYAINPPPVVNLCGAQHLALPKVICNISPGFLRQPLALYMPQGGIENAVIIPRADDHRHWHGMPHEQGLLFGIQTGQHAAQPASIAHASEYRRNVLLVAQER